MSSPNTAAVHRMDDEPQEGRMARKMRESPLMVIGMLGWCGVVGYGLYGIKNRKLPLAMHLIHTRVIAQACVVSALSIGVGYKIYEEHLGPYLFGKKDESASTQLEK